MIDYDERLEPFRLRVKAAVRELDEARSALDQEIRTICEERFGVKPGVVVEDRLGDQYLVTEVRHVDPAWRPWLKGRRRRKDGSWSKANQHVHDDWTIIEGES